MSEEELAEIKEKYFTEDEIPEGWVDIEEHLPMVTCQDFLDNDGIFKKVLVRDKDGNEFEDVVGDHNMWYYRAKEAGITHWWNGEVEDE